MKIDICVLTETKKKDKGNEKTGNNLKFYSGVSKDTRAIKAIPIVVHKNLIKNIKAGKKLTHWSKCTKEICILGDLNAKVGKKENDKVLGKHGKEIKYDNGIRLTGLCNGLSLKIMNGYFPHKNIQKSSRRIR